MKAIIKDTNFFGPRETAKPAISNDNDVIIKVALAGLCRTDVFVAEGTIKSKTPLILGHEFSGVIDEVGSSVKKLKKGDRVTVMPVIACRKCDLCKKDESLCQNTTMLGMDIDGCFAEYVVVPQEVVYKLPDGLSFKRGAYTEPLAASLAVVKANLPKNAKGLIYGKNRIAELTHRVLKAHGYKDVEIYDEHEGKPLLSNSYDFITETIANTESMEKIIDAVRPKGKIIIKSRKHELVGFNFAKLVRKEITMQAVNYGDFSETIKLMNSSDFGVDDLLGDIYDFEDFMKAFEAAKGCEAKKVFLSPNGIQ